MAKQAAKRSLRLNAENSFDAIAREWHAKYASTWSEGHGARLLRRLEVDAFPWIGEKPPARRSHATGRTGGVLQRVEKRGALETAHRLRENISQVLRYAVATGRAAQDIGGAGTKAALCRPYRSREGSRTVASHRRLLRHSLGLFRAAACPTAFPAAGRPTKCNLVGIRLG
jgi:hypothetical protein